MKVFIYLLFSIIALYGCGSSPEQKIADFESTKNKILDLNEVIPRPGANIFNIDNQANDTNDVIRARNKFLADLMETFLDDTASLEIKNRILGFYSSIIDAHGWESKVLPVRDSASFRKIIDGKEYLNVEYAMHYDSPYSLITKLLFYQEYAKLLGVNFNLNDRVFLAHELCNAVEENKLQYASALIDISVGILNPGQIRCRDISRNNSDVDKRASIKACTETTCGNSCARSLRRLSGRNYGRAVQSRISSWQSGVNIDRNNIKSLDDAKNKIKNTFRNIPSLNSVPGSMNSLLDRYDNTWARGGECSETKK